MDIQEDDLGSLCEVMLPLVKTNAGGSWKPQGLPGPGHMPCWGLQVVEDGSRLDGGTSDCAVPKAEIGGCDTAGDVRISSRSNTGRK